MSRSANSTLQHNRKQSKLWSRNRYSLPNRLFYPIVAAIVCGMVMVALISNWI
ncbi:hypothetical protein [Ferrimonas aestuarii]|uniref:hypothetical protein n=1 Tax=Ferrimonas aestuarii TaxID=2569539 RepID=UPI00145CD6C6|nr:hypothetical protein [Ferrimonas aestuarii]